MKFTVSILTIAILAYALGIYLPWWSLACAAFLIGAVIPQRNILSFFSGFLSVFILWFLLALMMSNKNGDILAARMSQVVLKNNQPFLLILLTGLIGGLVGGFAALSGSLFRKMIRP